MTPKEFITRLIEHCGNKWHVRQRFGFSYNAMQSWEKNTPLSWLHSEEHREKLRFAFKTLKLTQEDVESLKPKQENIKTKDVGTAEELKKIRQNMGMTQREFGLLIGYSKVSISNIERGKSPADRALKLFEQYQNREKAMVRFAVKTTEIKNTGATHILNGEPVRIVEISGRYRGFRKFGNDWQRSEYVETNIIHATPIGRRSAA